MYTIRQQLVKDRTLGSISKAANIMSRQIMRRQIMSRLAPFDGEVFRVWIADVSGWRASAGHEIPPRAVALVPAEDDVFSAAEAAAYVEGFNSQAIRKRRRMRAVAVKVGVRYQGDLQPGQALSEEMMRSLASQ